MTLNTILKNENMYGCHLDTMDSDHIYLTYVGEILITLSSRVSIESFRKNK